jgi:hypothetical protein
LTTSNLSPRFWKLLTLAEIVDNLLPDYEAPTIIRTAIVKKQNAEDINLNRTKTSQAARKVEDQLATALEKEYKKIMTDPSKDVGLLQRKYGPQVEQIIRAAVQKLYLIGSDYLTRSLETTAFITTKDLDIIKKAVTKFSEAFWKRISNAVHKQDFTIIPTTIKVAQVGDPTVEDPYGLSEDAPPESDPAADSAFLATLIATSILALSTLTKLDQIPSDQEQPRKLVWITEQDAKVCLICQGLQGQEWDEGDSNLPIPGPDSSHYNCRCRLMLKMGEDILSG